MDQADGFLVVSLGSIDKRLLVNRDQDDGVHGPVFPCRRVAEVRIRGVERPRP
jgi:hypothetical protein